jgi:Farnesoic acid 0-methyl transferase
VLCLNFFRKAKSGTNLVVNSTQNILNANNIFTSFWISWTNGIIQVGKGTAVGNSMFMFYNDASPSAVNYVALSGWRNAGSAFFNDGL